MLFPPLSCFPWLLRTRLQCHELHTLKGSGWKMSPKSSSSWPLSAGLVCFVSLHSVGYNKSLNRSQNAEWCTVTFFFCALTDFLGSASVLWLLSLSVLPEEGAFCFQRRRAITAGSTSPDASLGEGICLRATSVPCHELAKMLSPEGQHHFQGEAPS